MRETFRNLKKILIVFVTVSFIISVSAQSQELKKSSQPPQVELQIENMLEKLNIAIENLNASTKAQNNATNTLITAAGELSEATSDFRKEINQLNQNIGGVNEFKNIFLFVLVPLFSAVIGFIIIYIIKLDKKLIQGSFYSDYESMEIQEIPGVITITRRKRFDGFPPPIIKSKCKKILKN